MHDLTQGSIPKHLLRLAFPIFIGMLVQTCYFLTDLYFVGHLGPKALAGLSMAGNFMFVVLALTQVINIGAATLIAQAVGGKQNEQANAAFQQAMLLSAGCALLSLVLGFGVAEHYLNTISQDREAIAQGMQYLWFFIPCLALQFTMVGVSAGLRGCGVVKPTMQAMLMSTVLNIALTPILVPLMGIAGAGLASSIAVLLAILWLGRFLRQQQYLQLQWRQWRWQWPLAKRLLAIGLPAGGEYLIFFAFLGLVFYVIQGFGADAQAGFGLGVRIMQSLFLPSMAIALAAPAIAGQNFGAGHLHRVRATFFHTLWATCALMVALGTLCIWQGQWLFTPFSESTEVIRFGSEFIQIIGVNFVPSGVVLACGAIFQAHGRTIAPFAATSARLLSFATAVLLLLQQGDFSLAQVWYCSVASVFVQATVISVWLRLHWRRHLTAPAVSATAN